MHETKLHVLLIMESFNEAVVIYAFQQIPIRSVRMEFFKQKRYLLNFGKMARKINLGKFEK